MGRELTQWDSLATEVVVDHPWYRLRRDTVRLPSGRIVDDYFVSERVDVVLVFALTTADDVVLVHQWKQGRRAFYTELPGGMCEPGEDPRMTAARELLEETGYSCSDLRELGRFEPDPTRNTNAIVAYLGFEARRTAERVRDEQEDLEVRLLPAGKLLAEIHERRITSAGTVATIYRALDELGRIGIE